MEALSAGGLAWWMLAVGWIAGTMLAALAQPAKRRAAGRPIAAPAVSVVVPVSAPAAALSSCVESLMRLDYPDFDVMLCAASDDMVAVCAIDAMKKRHPTLRACLVTPAPLGNPKSGLLAVALPEARHDLLLLTDDNVVSSPIRIQAHLMLRESGHGLVSASVLGNAAGNFWAAVDAAFMNGQFARLQLAGDAVGLSFTTGKSIMVSRAALEASGGYAAAGQTMCEDAIIQQRLVASGERPALSHELVTQPLGRRRASEVWHRHLRWATCRRRHVALLFVVELAVSAPVTATAGGLASAGLDAGFTVGVLGSLGLLMALEASFLGLARWPVDHRFPAAWIVREGLSIALWVAALLPRRRVVWRDQTFVTATPTHGSREIDAQRRVQPNRPANRRTD